ncbi:DNA ligase [Stenotrophomonas sp. YIM B06876]|uniref:DNA ligase n=1 Tax=Stenotrophomonas sp. YIM B06876 TaxID=3060211 RepID=UPI002739A8F6|nr:DNA ligase [Stenotrophomonas sp. YIM B06876]
MSRVFVFLLAALLLMPAVPAAAGSPPMLMLANSWREGPEVSQYWVSEKLDGVRARWDGKVLWSRAGNRIDAPAWFVAGWPPMELDGELWLGRDRFDETSALVRTTGATDSGWRRLRFMVFDAPAHPGTFDARLEILQTRIRAAHVPWLQAIPQRQLADTAALHRHLREVVAAGGEGLMLHHRHGRYLPGRSDTLFKLKPWDDAEARVVAHVPGKGKYTGMLGALLVERADGRQFRLGSGFTDAQRAAPPPLGSHVTYRYNGLTSTGLPRFARFLRIREELPPPDPRRP